MSLICPRSIAEALLIRHRAVAILLAAAAHGLLAQPAEGPAFQVASIKRNSSAGPRGMTVRPQPGGRLIAGNAPLMLLIQNAYAVQAYQVVGGPAWINSDGYDVEAKPEGNTDRKQMWLMLETLLADRFKLALHRETRELPVYALTAAKGGPKLPPPKAGGCMALPPDAPTPPPPPPGSGRVYCGHVPLSMSAAGLRMEGSRVPMAEFIRTLAMVLGRPVLNETGFSGEFDFHLDFTPDEATMGLPGYGPGDPGGPRLPTDPDRPNIFAALQEQLGLKLASAKGPVEVLVIDHVERPTAN
jgi:uncharacterized protein (TIGR03435 family)